MKCFVRDDTWKEEQYFPTANVPTHRPEVEVLYTRKIQRNLAEGDNKPDEKWSAENVKCAFLSAWYVFTFFFDMQNGDLLILEQCDKNWTILRWK